LAKLIIKKIQMKKYFYCIFCFCIVWNVHLSGNVRKDELRERIYLQTDKQLYLAGELVLIKLFTVGQEQIPLVLSKIAYVELAGDSIAQIQIMIGMTGGTGFGQMQLPADLPSGYYRLIAYTQFMRNEGPEVFFEKNIAVLNTFLPGYRPEEKEATAEHLTSPPALLPSASPSGFAGEGAGAISLQTDKEIYTKRTRGQLILNGLPENVHTLSVSVTGKDLIPATESAPSLFQKNLLRQSSGFTNEFLPEYEGHIVTGKIIDNQTEKPVNDEISVISGISFPGEAGIRFFSGQKNGTSDVRFFTSGISGTKEIVTVVYFQDEKYRIEIQSPYTSHFTSKQMPPLHIDSAYYEQLLDRSVALQTFRYFTEDPSASQNITESFFNTQPTFSYPLDDYTRFTTMGDIFIEFIDGARFRRNAAGKREISVLIQEGIDQYTYGTMPVVLLDGVPVNDHDVIYNYDPLTVEKINIYYGPVILGGTRFDGIVELITYRKLYQDLKLNKSTQIFPYHGPQVPYRLDSPGYLDEKNRQTWMPDSRHTLLWNPDVRPDGKTSIQLPFDTSTLTGEFQATVEGLTKDGQFIFATVVFKVE